MNVIAVQPGSEPERSAYAALPGLAARLARGESPPGPGHWDEIEAPATLAGQAAGDVVLVHLRGAVVWPGRGIVLGPDGRIVQATEAGGRIARGDMARLRGMHSGPGGLRFVAPASMRRLSRGMVWMNAGAGANYGHFLFDALPPLLWAERAGLLARHAPLSPLLSRWQRDLVARAGIRTALREVRDDVVAVDHLILTTAQNHYLHRAGGMLRDLGGVLAASAAGEAQGDGPPVYLGRRWQTGRIIVNEAALLEGLRARGVRILQPGRMRVADQAAAVGGARILLGPSGAGLANLVFLAPGARVIEIRPGPVQEPWLDLACANLGLEHRIIRAPGPLPRGEVPLWARLAQLPRRVTGRYHYACRADVAAVMAALEGA